MSAISSIAKLAPWHFLSFATLLGTELYQTFVMTKVCYNSLPMSSFTTLNKRIFPIYFQGQTLLIILVASTFPPYGPLSLVNSLGDLIPIAFSAAMAVLNLVKCGPQTQKAMLERIHQETRDSTKFNDAIISDEMRARNKIFSRNHAMSIHVNLLAIGGTLWYGLRLASKLEFD